MPSNGVFQCCVLISLIVGSCIDSFFSCIWLGYYLMKIRLHGSPTPLLISFSLGTHELGMSVQHSILSLSDK